MRHRSILVAASIVTAALVGCYTGGHVSQGSSGSSPTQSTEATAAADLPCDVAQLLTDHCASCHGTTLSGGARNHLLGAADLTAPSTSDPSITVAQQAIERMKDAANPMPPDGLLPAATTAPLEAWVAAGFPAGSCAVDGGQDTNTPTVCTSNSFWTHGDRESPLMHPGRACIDCHAQGEGPRFTVAGTVFPTAHEPDDCNGVGAGAVKVVITDANGQVITLDVNAAGNFPPTKSRPPTIAMPYTAKVVSGDKVRAMKTPQTSGDCNGCHTERGTNQAPGRIYAP